MHVAAYDMYCLLEPRVILVSKFTIYNVPRFAFSHVTQSRHSTHIGTIFIECHFL